MQDTSFERILIERDGTSQAARSLPARLPDYVQVEERGVKEWLAFAQAFAKEIRYFNQQNQASGSWDRLIPEELDKCMAYLADPDTDVLSPQEKIQFAAPHRGLMLGFLQILEDYFKPQLNSFSARHLDFYYKDFLKLKTQAAVPDQVHVWVELTPKTDAVLIPEATLLTAGKDAEGKEILFRTADELVANPAKIDSLKSLFVEKEITGLQKARLEVLVDGERLAFIKMLEVALGDPRPGDPLPPFPTVFAFVPDYESWIDTVAATLHFISQEITLTFGELRQLILTKREIKPEGGKAEMALWSRVFKTLDQTGKNRQPGFKFPFGSNPVDFHNNFKLATGVDPVPKEADNSPFDLFPLVNNVYDLFGELKAKRATDEMLAFITGTLDTGNYQGGLYFSSVDAFRQMMQQVSAYRNDWMILYALLEKARRNKANQPNFDLEAVFPLDYTRSFEDLVQASVPSLRLAGSDYDSLANPAINSLETYHDALLTLEAYFFLPLEDLDFVFEIYAQNPSEEELEGILSWGRVYKLMQLAYARKYQASLQRNRAFALREVYVEQKANSPAGHKAAFDLILREALGSPNPGDQLPGGLNHLGQVKPSDTSYINELGLQAEQFDFLVNARNSFPVSDAALASISQILAEAETRIRGSAEAPPAQIVALQHIYASEDATQVEVSLGLGEEETLRWRTFGEGQRGRVLGARNMQAATWGFALRSPIFYLEAGPRSIVLSLTLKSETDLAPDIEEIWPQKPFQFFLSTAAEWYEIPFEQTPTVSPTVTQVEGITRLEFEISLALDEQVEAIAPITEIADALAASIPAMKVRLREFDTGELANEPEYENAYQYLRALQVEEVKVNVIVDALSPSHVENEQGNLDPAKPFEPFGLSPRVNARFYFAHPEIAFKKLEGIALQLNWMGVPDSDLGAYYQNYNIVDKDGNASPVKNKDFLTTLKFVERGLTLNLGTSLPLFNDTDAKEAGGIRLGRVDEKSQGLEPLENLINDFPAQSTYQYKATAERRIANKVKEWSRYFSLDLQSPGLLHERYPVRANQLAVKLAADTSRQEVKADTEYQINPPYTPKLESLSLSYRALEVLEFGGQASSSASLELLHEEAFGYRPVVGDAPYLLPDLRFEGALYIGITELKPPQNLAMLFQVAEGSADPELELQRIEWYYLSGDEWKAMDFGLLLSDTTNGLINSGILRFSIPSDASSEHTLMPTGKHWIRATIPSNTQSVCDLVAIHPQAVLAIFEDHDNDPHRLAEPLAPEQLTKLKRGIRGIKKLHQPYTSFGGKLAEADEALYTRLSERLRHKRRASTLWDYEHLVLEKFPAVYKVKCLPADIDRMPDEAGRVDVIVIPDIKGKLPFDPFEPKAPVNLLKEIEDYLAGISPPVAQIEVSNPEYIRLKLRFAVKFLPGKDIGFHLNLLEEELKAFLAPWAYDQGAEIEFGGKVYPNIVVNFIDEREYVDYVAGMSFFTSKDGISYLVATPGEDGGIQTDIPSAIWVSAREHQIDLITDTVFEEQSFEGVGHMKIELDFQVES